MRKTFSFSSLYLLFAALFLFLTNNLTAQTLTEGFETGLPTSGSSTVQNYTLSSGVWTILKGASSGTSHSGSFALKLSSGNTTPTYAIAPVLNAVSKVSFWAKGSSTSTVTILKSVNGGAYTTVAAQAITTTYTQYTINVNETGSNVRIEFENTTSQTLYIDDVTINYGSSAPAPAIVVAPATLSFGNQIINTISSAQTYSVSGSNLSPASGSITVTVPSGYLVSTTSASGYASSISVAYTGSTLAATTIYVEFDPTAVQSYSGNITNAGGGATTQNVAVSGAGAAVPTPTLNVTPSSLSFGSITVNTTSSSKTYTISGTALSPASGTITLTAPSGYQISTTSGSGYTSSVSVSYTGSSLASTTIYVIFQPTAAQAYSGNITNAGGGATTQNVAVSGTGIALTPSLSVTPSSLSFGNININTTSSEKTYTVSGANLSPASGSITVTAPTGYQLTTTSGSGYASSLSIAYTGGTLAATTIYTVFSPTAVQSYSGNITNASGGATTQNVAVSGAGVQPTLTVTPTLLSFGSVVINTTSSVQTYTVSGSNLSPASGSITITAPSGYKVSTTSGSGYASSISVSYTGSSLTSTTIYTTFSPTAVQSYSGNISNAGSGAATQNVAVTGSGIQQTNTGTTYYVSPTGSDSNPGTLAAPFLTLSKAMGKAAAGVTIYMRGGTYNISSTLKTSKSGSAGNYVNIWAYPGETPILNFVGESYSSSSRGIELNNDYWYLKGLIITNAGDNGIYIGGNNNIVENCVASFNKDTGIQISDGGSNNYIHNCDGFDNNDPATNGGNADGIDVKLSAGPGNVLRGCRAFNNSDDGFDCYGTANRVIFDSCWAFHNGYNLWNISNFAGNGNGFKLGGNFVPGPHKVTNCISFDNVVKGFDQNNNTAGVTLYNCTSYRNGTYDFSFPTAPSSGQDTLINDIAYVAGTSLVHLESNALLKTDSWVGSFTVNAASFQSIDTSLATLPRLSDGSLQVTNFFHLATGSNMINAGTNVGLPYNGSAPDLGYFESPVTGARPAFFVVSLPVSKIEALPNLFSEETQVQFSVANAGNANVKVFNSFGQVVATLYNGNAIAGNTYTVPFHAGKLATGIYFTVLESGNERTVNRVIIAK